MFSRPIIEFFHYNSLQPFQKIILIALCICFLSPAYAKTFVDGFETGSIHSDWKPSDSGSKTLSRIATSRACNGLYSLKSEASYPPDFVTSVSLVGRNPFIELKNGKEYWIGMAVNLANGWPKDNEYGEILLEAHGRPDENLGESWGRNPPLALAVQEGKWVIKGKTANKKVCTGCSNSVLYRFIGSYKPDTWTEFVFNVKFSHTKSGFLKVWKDNKLVLNYSGPIGYNDVRGPWLLFGVYKPNWKYGKSKIRTRTVYHDDIRIKEGKGSIADVAPNCGNKKTNLKPPTGMKIIQQ